MILHNEMVRLNVTRAPASKSATTSRGFYLKFTGILGVVLLVSLGKIYLERRTAHMGLEVEAQHKSLTQLVREIDNLRIDREERSRGNYILAWAARLDLRPSEPRQVRRIQVREADSDTPGQSTSEPWQYVMRSVQ